MYRLYYFFQAYFVLKNMMLSNQVSNKIALMSFLGSGFSLISSKKEVCAIFVEINSSLSRHSDRWTDTKLGSFTKTFCCPLLLVPTSRTTIITKN